MSNVSWIFSLAADNGLQHLAGTTESGVSLHLDMHPAALTQMTAAEFLAMLERRAQEETATVAPAAPEPAPAVTAEPAPEEVSA